MRRALTLLSCLLLFSLRGFEAPQPAEIPEGAYGVWQIPELGTSSPLYEGAWIDGSWNGQEIVDREDSALIRSFGRGRMIGDHLNSRVGGGIWDVGEIRVGSSAFLILQDRTLSYRCTAVWTVRALDYCYTYNGSAIWPSHSTDIFCASCTINDGENYLAAFELIGEMP